MISNALNNKVFLLLVVAVTLAFGAILWPYYEAVFWGVTLAILFAPLQKFLLVHMPARRNLAAQKPRTALRDTPTPSSRDPSP